MKVFEDAGLPQGALNLVDGSGRVVGDEFVNNPAVRAVSFTGSCELGGKNPAVAMASAG